MGALQLLKSSQHLWGVGVGLLVHHLAGWEGGWGQILSFCLFCQAAFAEANDTMTVASGNSTHEDVIDISSNEYFDSDKISIDNPDNRLSNTQNTTLFIVSDNPGTNILDKACLELFSENKLDNVNLIVRSGDQIKTMDESEFVNLLSSCDGFIGEWVSSDVDSVLTSVLSKDSSLSNKKLFLILEPLRQETLASLDLCR